VPAGQVPEHHARSKGATRAAVRHPHHRRVRDVRATLSGAVAAGRPGMRRPAAELEARRVLTVVTGMAAQAVFDPDDWPPARQRRMLRDALVP
jgi:hypothetical protein